MNIICTGSLGLVGSTATRYFLDQGHAVIGVDNDMRRHFFGENGSVAGNMITHGHYLHVGEDISKIERVFEEHEPDIIVHCAAQTSKEYALKNPVLDFGINAYGTVMLLEFMRKHVPNSVFICVSGMMEEVSASKLCSDIMVEEYKKLFGLKVGVLRIESPKDIIHDLEVMIEILISA